MARIGSISTQVAKDYLLKFPNSSKRALAKKLYKEHPSLFSNQEEARKKLRVLTGNAGATSRGNRSNSINAELDALKKEMPKGETEHIKPYKLPKSSRKVLLMSDLHIPFHSDEALFAALEYGLKEQVDTIIINGDLIDFSKISRHETDPRKRSVAYEISTTQIFLNGLRIMFPNALIVWSYGNHDIRYDKWIMQKAPELLDIDAIQLHELMKLRDLSIVKVESMQYIYAGKLAIFHGHETGLKSGGVNPARSLRLKLNKSAVTSHFHRETKDMGVNLGEHPYSCYSIGCLCDLTPAYMPINNWTHGFAIIELSPNGDYVFIQKSIINGKVF